MARHSDTVWCDGCGSEILWAPLVVGGRDYCCSECLAGRSCRCGERMELEERRRSETAASQDSEPSGA